MKWIKLQKEGTVKRKNLIVNERDLIWCKDHKLIRGEGKEGDCGKKAKIIEKG